MMKTKSCYRYAVQGTCNLSYKTQTKKNQNRDISPLLLKDRKTKNKIRGAGRTDVLYHH